MLNSIIYNLLGIVAVFFPVFLLFTIGPETTRRRLVYGISGLAIAALIGGILYVLAVDTRIAWTDPRLGRLARDITAAITEEIIRYPGILIAQYLGIRYYTRNTEEVTLSEEKLKLADDEFTTIIDPHGMGMFFGVGYGMGETFAFYIYPTFLEIIAGNLVFDFAEELIQIIIRITAVFAHVGLTYLAMAITSQKGFWRITIFVHLTSNVSNRIFTELAPNEYSVLVFIMFTRFAILLVAYFMLRPKIRYLSPAVLVFLLVLLFLIIILIATFIALLVGFLTNIAIEPI